MEEDSYEKDVLFYVQLGDPKMAAGVLFRTLIKALYFMRHCALDDKTTTFIAEAERKRPDVRSERERVALLGLPRLGELIRAQIRIKESKEFKVRDCFVFIMNLGCSFDFVFLVLEYS